MTAVLLAEDEPVSRAFLRDALDALGVRCDAVEDGVAAVGHATRVRYDALLLDLNLPGCDGVAIVRQLRADAGAASHAAPALALTADDSAGTRQRLLDAGFAAVAGKPIGVEQLGQALRALRLRVADVRDTTDAASALSAASASPLWDDAAALAAVGGNRSILDTLRTMMLKELALQRAGIADALQRRAFDVARAELHRLQAGCGFCGAARLAQTAAALQAALGSGLDIDDCSRRFLDEADALLRVAA